MRLPFIIFSLFISSLSLAQVYQSTDDQGNPSFSDKPSSESKKISLPETNTTKAIEVTAPPARIQPQATDSSIYQSLSISSPRNDSVISNGLYPFNVNLAVKPKLQQGHKIELLIDGKSHSSSTMLSRQVESIPRGKHTLSAKVINKKGKSVISSKPVTLTVYRPTTNNSTNNNAPSNPGGPVHLPSRPGINPPKNRPSPRS